MEYLTIDKASEGLFKDRGSKFIAYTFPIESAEDVEEYLKEVKELHSKARHHCYAYRIGTDGNNYRINDDGEPSGSAGMPIFNTLRSNEITNVLSIVVRYFGGTKLGIPGLINAYSEAVKLSLEATNIVKRHPLVRFKIDTSYAYMPTLFDAVKRLDIEIPDKSFTANGCAITLELPQKDEEKLMQVFGLVLNREPDQIILDELPEGLSIEETFRA